MKIRVNTPEELHSYQQQGYTSSTRKLAYIFDLKYRTARELSKGIPRVELSDKLHKELKQAGEGEQPKHYYNPLEVMEHLIERGVLNILCGIPEDETPVRISKEYALEESEMFFTLMEQSLSVQDIAIQEEGYALTPFVLRTPGNGSEKLYTRKGEYVDGIDVFSLAMGSLIKSGDIYNSGIRNKYLRAVMKSPYIEFQIKGSRRYYCSYVFETEPPENIYDEQATVWNKGVPTRAEYGNPDTVDGLIRSVITDYQAKCK